MGEGRKDHDFAVIRLNPDGTQDTGFARRCRPGGHRAQCVGDPKTALELADGRLVVTEYANVDGIVNLAECPGAGTRCGGCHMMLRRLLAEAGLEPAPAADYCAA